MHYSASKFLKIKFSTPKWTQTQFLMDVQFLNSFFLGKGTNRTHEICLSEESECIFQNEEVNKSTSVLHRVWSIEKRLFRSQISLKRPDLRWKPSKLPEGPLWANFWRRVLSHHLTKKEWVPPQNCFQNALKLQTLKERKSNQSWIENSVSSSTKCIILHQNSSKSNFRLQIGHRRSSYGQKISEHFVSWKRDQLDARNLPLGRT